MADNQHVNKVVYGSTVLIDLTADTVTADKILASYTAHDATGNTITGTCDFDVNSQDANVKVAEILSGKTAYARGTKLTGTMPNNGSVALTISTLDESVSIAQGYHDGRCGRVHILQRWGHSYSKGDRRYCYHSNRCSPSPSIYKPA